MLGRCLASRKANAIFWLLLEGLVPRIDMGSFNSNFRLTLSRALKVSTRPSVLGKVFHFFSVFTWMFSLSFYDLTVLTALF